MKSPLRVNGIWLPEPVENLSFSPEKVKNENETEAGSVIVIVVRTARLTISGSWTLTGPWMEQFRLFQQADTVTVEAYYPNPATLSTFICQFEIDSEVHIRKSRKQVPRMLGLYQVQATIREV